MNFTLEDYNTFARKLTPKWNRNKHQNGSVEYAECGVWKTRSVENAEYNVSKSLGFTQRYRTKRLVSLRDPKVCFGC